MLKKHKSHRKIEAIDKNNINIGNILVSNTCGISKTHFFGSEKLSLY